MEVHENSDKKLVWSDFEFEEKEHTEDWFWALGIIVITSGVAAIIFGNYFFAALIVIAGALLGFFAIKKPETVVYELNSKGLKIKNRIYPYEHIKSFWIQINRHAEDNFKPMLFLHTERVFLPILELPIHEDTARDIHEIMTDHDITETEMKEHPGDKIMEVLGF